LALEMLCLRPSTIKMKMKSERGSPFLIPLLTKKVLGGELLIRME
jgi:hypothetical protein